MGKIPVLQSGRPQTCVRERQRQRYLERDGRTARETENARISTAENEAVQK